MAAKRTTKPARPPEGATRARATATAAKRTACATATKKVAKKKTAAATAPAKRAGVLARQTAIAKTRTTIAKTRKLVDDAPIAVDDGDDVARAKIAALREAKAKAADHRGRARRSAVERLNDPPPAAGAVLIERVSRAIERELTQIEAIVGGHHVAPRQRSEAERRARTLASLARTLREVMTLRANDRKEKSEDDDAVPRDIGELRLALARRLDRLVADAKAARPATPE